MTHLKKKTYRSREEWLAARKNLIGGSDAAAALGLSRWKSPFQLWCEKTGAIPAEDATSEAAQAGHILEPVVADWYGRATKRRVIAPAPFTIHYHPTLLFLGATLDRIVVDKKLGRGVLEVKTTSSRYEEDWQDEPPLLAQVQIQIQLMVTGFSWGSATVLIGGQKFRWQDVKANLDFQRECAQRLDRFWSCVRYGVPPAPTGSEADSRALSSLYLNYKKGKSVLLPHSFSLLDAELAEAKKREKEYADRIREIENKIKFAIKDSESGVIPGTGVTYTYTLTERPEHLVKGSAFRVLRRKELKR